jgi:hypothetical protein
VVGGKFTGLRVAAHIGLQANTRRIFIEDSGLNTKASAKGPSAGFSRPKIDTKRQQFRNSFQKFKVTQLNFPLGHIPGYDVNKATKGIRNATKVINVTKYQKKKSYRRSLLQPSDIR